MKTSAPVRSEIVEFLRRELIGPDLRPEHASLNAGEEILRPQDPPRLRYSAGVLFPKAVRIELQENASREEADSSASGPPDEAEIEDISSDGASADIDDVPEHEVNRANEFLPSAMGLTALVRLPEALKVTVRAGRYERQSREGLGTPSKEGDWKAHHWRKPVAPAPVAIDCSRLSREKVVTREFPLDTGIEGLNLGLHIYSRPSGFAGDASKYRTITFTLINRTEMTGSSPKDSECFFQSEFFVEAENGGACFLEYPERANLEDDLEDKSLRMLYRHRKTFAVGHGCAATWPDCEDSAVHRIATDSLPTYDIKPIVPREISGLDLSMGMLSRIDDPATIETCRHLAQEYLFWIEQQEAIATSPEFPDEYRTVAIANIQSCRHCYDRIVDGIHLLEADLDSRLAFSWMNRAMLEQQLHYDLTVNQRRTWVGKGGLQTLERAYECPNSSSPPAGKGRWRPFQLAFILMNLRAISERECAQRSLVDLIWFPTGGGKTEAYLGLTAFSILRRRLLSVGDDGTSVLMRYTLRLLTTQQFQRAASLICACELIRRDNSTRLGPSRISIGLWVGKGVTPNWNRDAISALNTLHRNGTPNPFVLLTCPWCGAEMGPVRNGNAYRLKGYRKIRGRVSFVCEDTACAFSDSPGLPLLVVDEAIYDERPTLVIGTVDKFAMLPWLPEARSLFGLGNSKNVAPPDLIIQDELHLIAGALGSMVGMYETTIDALCHRQSGTTTVGPKIVASTATICRAAQQAHALYACGERNVFLFPPQGLRAGNSFFAEEVTQGHNDVAIAGRLYVGVFGSALSSHVTAQVRVMSALLQSVKCVETSTLGDLNGYWTLMAYFNSLRELGHAATLVRADIREHLNAVWDRLEIRKPPPGTNTPDRRRFINRDLELTSRVQSGAVTDVLQDLFTAFPGTTERRPVDVCLATNMIQVGLDVPRLGLMTVVGQPKTTAEYIQATSRVGRDERWPGLVVTVFNTGKPRDRSHFEHFRSYHQSIYRWVEPTSVTPFSVPVRERALHAQLVTLVRYWGDANTRERPSPPPPLQLFDRVRRVLVDRVQRVDPSEAVATDLMLSRLIERWRRVQPAIYGHFGMPPQETPLMYPSGTEPRAIWASRAKATPSSMRNVDSGCDADVLAQFPTE